MAYVGQNNLTAGAAVGQEILKHVKSGDLVAGIIATPGTGNIQPRIDGAKPVLTGGRRQVRRGRDFGDRGRAGVQQDLLVVRRQQGCEVDDGRRQRGQQRGRAVHQERTTWQGKVGASVWDVGLPVAQAINAGYVTATIDQQAYLQGFDTIMQLFLWNVSGGLMRPTDTDTGIGIVTKANVAPYLVANQVRGNVCGEEGIDAAVLDRRLVAPLTRATRRSNVCCCCPGGQPAGAAARSSCRRGGAFCASSSTSAS